VACSCAGASDFATFETTRLWFPEGTLPIFPSAASAGSNVKSSNQEQQFTPSEVAVWTLSPASVRLPLCYRYSQHISTIIHYPSILLDLSFQCISDKDSIFPPSFTRSFKQPISQSLLDGYQMDAPKTPPRKTETIGSDEERVATLLIRASFFDCPSDLS
jgi:hypothetical protein